MPVDSGGGGHPRPMQDAGRTVQPLDKHLHRAGQRWPGVHLPGAYHKHLRSAFNTLDAGTGHREGVAPRTDLHIDNCSYANLVLGSLMMPPDDAFRRLSVRWAWPDLPH